MDRLGWQDGIDGYFQQPPDYLPLYLSDAYLKGFEEGFYSRVY